MKISNRVVYTQIKGYYAKVSFDLKFSSKITFLDGDSGTGKTFLAKAILTQPDYLTVLFDHKYLAEEKLADIAEYIKTKKDRFIIIDNADILLTDKLRELIYQDKNNQYLIIGRDPKGLFLSERNFVDIDINENNITFKQKF